VLSPQQVVDCSFYSQGCDGGFAYLTAGKFAKDYGMVEEACLPYQGNETTYCPHARLKPCRRWFSNNHRYIGGFYGATTERAMRREIFLHGPVAVGLQVYPDLSKYKTGIYHYTGIPAEDTRLSPDDPLEPVNHALVAVGYGVDARTGEKYWVIQNSWGPEWGDKGYFKIRRGADEVGVESLVMAADPVL
jgi:cathepsin C